MNNIKQIFQESFSMNDVSIKLYGYSNVSSKKKVLNIIKENNIDISHFGLGKKNIKHERIERCCPICQTPFITPCGGRGERLTCSRSCSNKYFRHGENNPNFDKDKYKETYEKVSKTLLSNEISREYKYKNRKCPICEVPIIHKPKHQIYCSPECQSKRIITDSQKEKQRIKALERVKNGTHNGWNSRNIISYPEKFFMNVLENNNIKYAHNYPVNKRDLGIDEPYSYFIDFQILDKNISLEIDGRQHNDRKEHDQKRDQLLISNGYDVYRIKWKSINTPSGKNYIKNEIDKFIDYYNNK